MEILRLIAIKKLIVWQPYEIYKKQTEELNKN